MTGSAPIPELRGDRRGPQLLVPDNTKVAVIKACLYEPQVNRTYAEMAAHYDTAILPARPRRPRQSESRGSGTDHRTLAAGRLRHRRFHSMTELNAAIGELLQQLNEVRPIRRLGVTRRTLLEELDRPYLKQLPSEPYAFAEWRLRRVGSITMSCRGPLLQRPLPLRPPRGRGPADAAHRRGLYKGERIAAHLRSSGNHRHTTVADHMPRARRYADWTIERIRREAAAIGPATAALCELILERRPHPEQAPRHRPPGAAIRRRSPQSGSNARPGKVRRCDARGAARGSSPTLRPVASVIPGRDGKAGSLIELKSELGVAFTASARDVFLLRPADASLFRR